MKKSKKHQIIKYDKKSILNRYKGEFSDTPKDNEIKATIQKIKKSSKEDTKKLEQKLSELVKDRGIFQNSYAIPLTVYREQFKHLVGSINDQLIDEFDAQKPSEKSLCHIVASAYGRVMEFSNALSNIHHKEMISELDIKLYNFYSKEIDRAEKQYLNGLNTLLASKQALMKVNINTNNAFIADKQINQNNIQNENK